MTVELVMENLEVKALAIVLKQQLKNQMSIIGNPKEFKSAMNDFDSAIEYLISLQKLKSERRISLHDKLEAAKGAITSFDDERAELKVEVLQLMVATEHIMFLQYFKTEELGTNFLEILGRKQFLSSTLLIRALHELTATISYIQEETSKRFERIEKQVEVKKTIKEVKNTKSFFERNYYG